MDEREVEYIKGKCCPVSGIVCLHSSRNADLWSYRGRVQSNLEMLQGPWRSHLLHMRWGIWDLQLSPFMPWWGKFHPLWNQFAKEFLLPSSLFHLPFFLSSPSPLILVRGNTNNSGNFQRRWEQNGQNLLPIVKSHSRNELQNRHLIY